MIKEYRNEQSLSIEEFARSCGRSKGYISMLERGSNPASGKPITPSIDTVTKIASAMHISVDKLLSMSDEFYISSNHGDSLNDYPDSNQGHPGGIVAEEVLAYYDGTAFIPAKPVSIRKNQPVLVKMLDETTMSPEDMARHFAKQLKGILSGSNMSSDAFIAQKQTEKELER